jgi:uncharacterized membrane protein (UPF0136 family)
MQATTSTPLATSSALLLGLLTASGGITGYIRTSSLPSLIAGCSVGALYLAGGYLMRNAHASERNYGQSMALAASVILAGSSVPRAMRSGKPLPVGLSLLAGYGLVVFGGGVWAEVMGGKGRIA